MIKIPRVGSVSITNGARRTVTQIDWKASRFYYEFAPHTSGPYHPHYPIQSVPFASVRRLIKDGTWQFMLPAVLLPKGL